MQANLEQKQNSVNLDFSFEIEKDPLEESDPIDYMNSVPLKLDPPTNNIQKMSSNSTASSGGNSSDENDNGGPSKPTKFKSPKPTVTETTLLEKHSSAQPKDQMPELESPKAENSEFIKNFFQKMKLKSQKSNNYNDKV